MISDKTRPIEESMLALQDVRVLIIEDTVENMRLFHALMKLEGAIAFEALGALEGIEIAQREQPDIILMDVHMPGMDGLTATRLLRADGKTKDIPIVAVTASVMLSDVEELHAAGCDGYISKPIEANTFANQIAAYLRPKIDEACEGTGSAVIHL